MVPPPAQRLGVHSLSQEDLLAACKQRGITHAPPESVAESVARSVAETERHAAKAASAALLGGAGSSFDAPSQVDQLTPEIVGSPHPAMAHAKQLHSLTSLSLSVACPQVRAELAVWVDLAHTKSVPATLLLHLDLFGDAEEWERTHAAEASAAATTGGQPKQGSGAS